jgi:hypothetical protein
LCEEIKYLAKKSCKDSEAPFLVKNNGKWITQQHFHVVPSIGGLKKLVTTLEPELEYHPE